MRLPLSRQSYCDPMSRHRLEDRPRTVGLAITESQAEALIAEAAARGLTLSGLLRVSVSQMTGIDVTKPADRLVAEQQTVIGAQASDAEEKARPRRRGTTSSNSDKMVA